MMLVAFAHPRRRLPVVSGPGGSKVEPESQRRSKRAGLGGPAGEDDMGGKR